MKNPINFKKRIKALMLVCMSALYALSIQAQTISGFTLIDADSDSELFQLVDNQTINFQDLPTTNLNIVANTTGTVGSVVFLLNSTVFRTESFAPYALAGDNAGDYYVWTPNVGAIDIEAQVYSSSGGNGTLLNTLSITVTFTDEPTEILVTDLSFINCPISPLLVGDIIDLDVSITPANATNTTVAFTASDGLSVGYLDGLFTALASGSITVGATSFSDGSVFDQCTIDVVDVVLDPYSTVSAIDFNEQNGIQLANSNTVVGYVNNGDYIGFDNVGFNDGPSMGTVSASSNNNGGQIEFRTESVTGTLIATATITNTGGWTNYQDFDIEVINPTQYLNGTSLGLQDLYMVFTGGSGYLFDVEEFIFTPAVDILVTGLAFTNCPSESLSVGEVFNLDVLVTPSNASNQEIAFTASDGISVGYLSGEFTAQTSGQITVTATSFSDGTVFDQCLINVVDAVDEVDPYNTVKAIDFDDQSGIILSNNNTVVGHIQNNDYISFDNVAFDNGPSLGTVRASSNTNGGQIEFRTGALDGTLIATADIQNTGGWTNYQDFNINVINPSQYTSGTILGTSSLYLVFTGTESALFDVDEFVFDKAVPSTSVVSGALKKWHKVTVSFEGPNVSETDLVNPFTDYRLNVTFTNGSKTYIVPGFYAADGDAENTSADSGNIWQVHFSPDEVGTWSYAASFRTGTDIAISTVASEGIATSFDGETGTFDIEASDKTGDDFRAKGRLQYVGEHYLQFAETGEYFFKVGPDAPENTFAYEDFDGTPNAAGRRKSWALHAADFDLADAGDYTWGAIQSDNARANGRELLGVIKYLADEGMNAFSFLTYNIDGDDKNVYPHLQIVNDATSFDDVHHDRFDVSKLAQWEKILEYADQKGIYQHFKTQETENDQNMDGGQLGRERKLYYRELIARFGHHLALNWNLGEENDIWQELSDPNNDIVKSYAQYVHDLDPYDHNIVIHTYPGQQDEVYDFLVGNQSELTGASVQTDITNVHGDVKRWVEDSRASGKKWVVANDEQGSANAGVAVDASYPDALLPEGRNVSDNREAVRGEVLWGTMLAGGAGVEYYYGYQTGCDDLDCGDHRTRQTKWDDAKVAIDFFENYLEPYATQMISEDDLTSVTDDYVFAQEGEIYAIYLPSGGTTDLDLISQSGSFEIKWYDPINGGSLQDGTVSILNAGSTNSIGLAPSNTTQDWVVLITKAEEQQLNVLIYHETNGFRHGSITQGIAMVNDLATSYNWTVQDSQVSSVFDDGTLADVDVVMFLNTSGNDLLTTSEQASFEQFIQNGGGFVGVHAATDTYRDGSWPWYNDLVGAIVQTSPNHTSNNTNATMDVVGDHPAIDHLGTEWNKSEEYYYWELNGGYLYSGNINLLQVRTTGSNTYDEARPITWYKEYDGGRSFYTALGHNGSDYSGDSDFITMLENAILWTGGQLELASGARSISNDKLLTNLIDMTYYPNPVGDILTIELSNDDPVNIKVRELSGKVLVIQSYDQRDVKLDMSSFQSGFYLVEIEQSGLKRQLRVLKK